MTSVAQNKKAVLIAAGGTGGHVFPALAVCKQLQQIGVPVIWLGTERGLESRVVPEAKISFAAVELTGFRGKSISGKLLAPLLLIRSLFFVWNLMRAHHVAVVIGFGGYVSAAAGVAAVLAGKTLLLQEQNAVAGTSNKLLARFAKQVFAGFPGVFAQHKGLVVSGNPLRSEITAAAQTRRLDKASSDTNNSVAIKIVVLGGSLGALPINRIFPDALALLRDEIQTNGHSGPGAMVSVVHQTGKGHLAGVQDAYSAVFRSGESLLDVEAVEFVEEMDRLLVEADLVVARAGALTVSELLVMGIPSILIPLPHAIDDHQLKNAEYLASRGAARLLAQVDLTGKSLASLLFEFFADRSLLTSMSEAALDLAKPDAASIVAHSCLECCLD